MENLSLEEKKAQFDEYFSIQDNVNINVKPLAEGETAPSEAVSYTHLTLPTICSV